MEEINVVEKDMTPRLIGETYLRKAKETSKHSERYGLYECQYCGRNWEVMVKSITKSGTKSCGCIRYNTTHGLTRHRLFQTWNNMIQRCTNTACANYTKYGGRGITVCDGWLDVTNFVAWAEATHPNIEGYTLDRIDNDKGYNPENCRWADRTTQNINQRVKKNNTSGFVGIIWNPLNKNWRASIRFKNEKINLGSHKTIEEAVQARDKYILENNLPHKLSTDYKKEIK